MPASGAAQWREYIIADGRMVAERTTTVGGAAAMQYFVADHLGSIAVVTDASGNVTQRMVYDPWGVQLASDGSQLCGAGPTTRGYTGEEQMPTGCLVNLNARVYDPILGRFMSGDPVTGALRMGVKTQIRRGGFADRAQRPALGIVALGAETHQGFGRSAAEIEPGPAGKRPSC